MLVPVLVLDRNSQPAKLSRINFAGVFSADTKCHLTWEGFFTRFCRAIPAHLIGRDASKTSAEVLIIYTRFFKDAVFKGREYDDLCRLIACNERTTKFPDDPAVRFLVWHALHAGLDVQPLTVSHASETQKRHVNIDGRPCGIYRHNRPSCEIAIAPLERGTTQVVGYVQCRERPIRGLIVPSDVLLRKGRMTSDRQHVVIEIGKKYPDAIELREAA